MILSMLRKPVLFAIFRIFICDIACLLITPRSRIEHPYNFWWVTYINSEALKCQLARYRRFVINYDLKLTRAPLSIPPSSWPYSKSLVRSSSAEPSFENVSVFGISISNGSGRFIFNNRAIWLMNNTLKVFSRGRVCRQNGLLESVRGWDNPLLTRWIDKPCLA